jgi:hypothetical protein
MNSKTHSRFWTCFRALPAPIQRMAVAKFRLWQNEPFHPSLRFKELADGLWSARITRGYRALARRNGDLVVWFWIGTHEDYDQLVSR